MIDGQCCSFFFVVSSLLFRNFQVTNRVEALMNETLQSEPRALHLVESVIHFVTNLFFRSQGIQSMCAEALQNTFGYQMFLNACVLLITCD